jgi:hypothetical protein
MATDTIGSIATFIVESFNRILLNIPTGVSGNMVEIVDIARQHVENYVGTAIGSNAIQAKYQPAITNFAKADVIDMINAQAGGESLSLGELSMGESRETMIAEYWRTLAEKQLSVLGQRIHFARSIS